MDLVLEMFDSGSIHVLCKTKTERILCINNTKKVQKFCFGPELLQPPYYRTEMHLENYSPSPPAGEQRWLQHTPSGWALKQREVTHKDAHSHFDLEQFHPLSKGKTGLFLQEREQNKIELKMVSIEVKEIVTFDFLNKGPFPHGGEERQNPAHGLCCCCSEAQLVLRLPWAQSSWGPTSQKDLNVTIVHTVVVFLCPTLRIFFSDSMYF